MLNDTLSLHNDKRGDIYSDMQCPKCSTLMQLMRKYEALIDYCPSCKGVWLDRGEIDKIAQIQSSYEDDIITNTITTMKRMMTIIMIIEGEGGDFLVTCLIFKILV